MNDAAADTPSPSTPTLRCAVGFSYEPKGRKALRFEIGDNVADLPQSVIERQIAKGAIVAGDASNG